MYRVSDSYQLLMIIQNKCRLRQTFMRIERRNMVFLVKNKKTEYRFNRRKIKYNNKTISRNRIAVLFKAVKQAYHDYITKNNFTIDVPKKIANVRGSNSQLFKNLAIGEKFYYLDVRHAYWQVAYKMGMLSEKLYNRYADDKEMKLFRNMSFACVLAPKKVDYIVRGCFMNTIIEDTSIYRELYRKIRHTTYNLIGYAKTLLNDKWIDYNIDGISFTADSLEQAEQIFKELDYVYTLNKCEKLNEYQYVKDDGEIKHFGRKRISEIVDKNN